MKRIESYSLALLLILCGIFTACSDFEPEGMPEVPYLPKASDLKADVSGRSVTLHWTLPDSKDITGVRVSCDGQAATLFPAGTTSCTLKG